MESTASREGRINSHVVLLPRFRVGSVQCAMHKDVVFGIEFETALIAQLTQRMEECRSFVLLLHDLPRSKSAYEHVTRGRSIVTNADSSSLTFTIARWIGDIHATFGEVR